MHPPQDVSECPVDAFGLFLCEIAGIVEAVIASQVERPLGVGTDGRAHRADLAV